MSSRKLTQLRLLIFLAITLPTVSGFAQNSPASATPVSPKPDVQELSQITERALINGCASVVAEIKAGRAYIKELESLTDAQKRIIAEQSSQIILLQQIVDAKTDEAKALRSALDRSTDALAKSAEAIEKTDKRAAKMEAKAKRRGAFGLGATATTVILVLILVL